MNTIHSYKYNSACSLVLPLTLKYPKNYSGDSEKYRGTNMKHVDDGTKFKQVGVFF